MASSNDNKDDLNNEIIKERKLNKNRQIELCGRKSEFNDYLYKKYDIPARDTIKRILGEYICDNPDKYGEDMILLIDGCKYKYLELQVCADWTGDKFPHSSLYIYERKIKFADNTLFLVFNKAMTKGYLFSRKSITGEPKRIKKYSGEFIYEIPWNRAMLVYMDNFTPETILMYS